MFDVGFQAQIAKVSISVKAPLGIVRRICKITLARVFDDIIAAGIGKAARDALKAIKAHDIEAVTMPIDAIQANGELVCSVFSEDGEAKSDRVAIPAMKGVKAKAKAGKDPDDPPIISVEFSFEWNEQAWVFLGRHCEAYAEVMLERREVGQLELGAKVTPITKGAPKGGAH